MFWFAHIAILSILKVVVKTQWILSNIEFYPPKGFCLYDLSLHFTLLWEPFLTLSKYGYGSVLFVSFKMSYPQRWDTRANHVCGSIDNLSILYGLGIVFNNSKICLVEKPFWNCVSDLSFVRQMRGHILYGVQLTVFPIYMVSEPFLTVSKCATRSGLF